LCLCMFTRRTSEFTCIYPGSNRLCLALSYFSALFLTIITCACLHSILPSYSNMIARAPPCLGWTMDQAAEHDMKVYLHSEALETIAGLGTRGKICLRRSTRHLRQQHHAKQRQNNSFSLGEKTHWYFKSRCKILWQQIIFAALSGTFSPEVRIT